MCFTSWLRFHTYFVSSCMKQTWGIEWQQKKPFLKELHMTQGLEFVRNILSLDSKAVRVCCLDQMNESMFEIRNYFRVIQVSCWYAFKKFQVNCIVPTFKSGHVSCMIWGAFAKKQKSRIVFMSKDKQKTIDFVELVYDGKLIQFMSNGIYDKILMKDGIVVWVV